MFALKLERYTLYLPNSVMEGFTLAIAFLISLNQLDFIFGLELKKKQHFYENVYRSFAHLDEAKWEPMVCFGVFFPALFGLSTKYVIVVNYEWITLYRTAVPVVLLVVTVLTPFVRLLPIHSITVLGTPRSRGSPSSPESAS